MRAPFVYLILALVGCLLVSALELHDDQSADPYDSNDYPSWNDDPIEDPPQNVLPPDPPKSMPPSMFSRAYGIGRDEHKPKVLTTTTQTERFWGHTNTWTKTKHVDAKHTGHHHHKSHDSPFEGGQVPSALVHERKATNAAEFTVTTVTAIAATNPDAENAKIFCESPSTWCLEARACCYHGDCHYIVKKLDARSTGPVDILRTGHKNSPPVLVDAHIVRDAAAGVIQRSEPVLAVDSPNTKPFGSDEVIDQHGGLRPRSLDWNPLDDSYQCLSHPIECLTDVMCDHNAPGCGPNMNAQKRDAATTFSNWCTTNQKECLMEIMKRDHEFPETLAQFRVENPDLFATIHQAVRLVEDDTELAADAIEDSAVDAFFTWLSDRRAFPVPTGSGFAGPTETVWVQPGAHVVRSSPDKRDASLVDAIERVGNEIEDFGDEMDEDTIEYVYSLDHLFERGAEPQLPFDLDSFIAKSEPTHAFENDRPPGKRSAPLRLPSSITPGFKFTQTVEDNGVPATAVGSVVETSPPVIAVVYAADDHTVEVTTTVALPTDGSLNDESGVLRKRKRQATPQHTFTMTVSDMGSEGQSTLNPPVTSDPAVVTQTTTVLQPGPTGILTTDDQGKPIYVTRTGNWADHTVTVTYEDDGTTTVTRYSQSAASDGPIATVTMISHDDTRQATLIPTYDSAGNPLFITRTGNFASTTTTMTPPGLIDTRTPIVPVTATSTTTLPAVTKITTSTVTEMMFPFQTCRKTFDPSLTTAVMANIGGKNVTITKATQMIGNNTQVVTKPVPHATLYPISSYQDFVFELLELATQMDAIDYGHRHILDSDMGSLRGQMPYVDWFKVAELAYILRQHHKAVDGDMASKVALMWVLERSEQSTTPSSNAALVTLAPKLLEARKHKSPALVATETFMNINGTVFPVHASATRLANGTMATAVPFDYNWAAQQEPIPTPPACQKSNKGIYNKRKCRYQECMLKHYKPIQIATVYPAAVLQDSGSDCTGYGYVTQSTRLVNAHFGTTKTHATYYPMKPTVTATKRDLQPTMAVVRDLPDGRGWWERIVHHPEGDPTCWNQATCCKECCKLTKHDPWNLMMWASIAAAVLLTLIALLMAGCTGLLWRRHSRTKQSDPNHSMLDHIPAAVPYFGRRNRQHAANAVDPATGQPVGNGGSQQGGGGGGSSVDPALAAAGGAAAGSALTSEKQNGGAGGGSGGQAGNAGGQTGNGGQAGSGAGGAAGGDDGRGTMGRKAEEGRGKVSFADGGAAGAGQGGGTGQAGGAGQTGGASDAGQAGGDGGRGLVTTTPSGEETNTSAPADGATSTTGDKAIPASGPTEQVVTTSTANPASDAHAEPVTAHHDGTYDAFPTGRQMVAPADMGSMRGRKKHRHNGGYNNDVLN